MLNLLLGAALSAALGGTAPSTPVSTPKLELGAARAIVRASVEQAQRDGSGGAIAIVDASGEPLLLERLDGTFAASGQISIGKARTAARFGKPTRVFEELINKGRTAMTALPEFTPLIGGLPLLVDGVVVGAIGVSGGKSADHDEQLALAGVQAFESWRSQRVSLALPAGAKAETASVVHRKAAEVARAFEKGMPLIEVADYKVHASRRDSPGEVEVHATETDIVYVLAGHATLVTGGELVDARKISALETRAKSVRGGEVQALAPGDLVVVPRGTPHWFREVQAPFTYYVVKVISPMEVER
ncbi:MAG: heme-binding protein [Planctomycetes bacterium]|nr:heme-binding protein [Planctomycetota bacterium]